MGSLVPEMPQTALDTLPVEMQQFALEALRRQHLSTINTNLNSLGSLIEGDREALANIQSNIHRTTMRLDQVISYLERASYSAFIDENTSLANLYITHLDRQIQENLPAEPLPEAAR